MPSCPRCHARYPPGTEVCPADGEDLSGLQAADDDLETGEQVGEYIVEGKLGQGTFGSVFEARHPLIGKAVAVKVLNAQYSVDPEIASRFVSEAQAVNKIGHPNIVDIFSFGRLGDGRLYYIMELLNGEGLDLILKARGRLEFTRVLTILRPLARALDAAHQKGVAHRDLKPANIVIVESGDGEVMPKLVDFGIAKLMGDEAPKRHKTATGAPLGTPYYMSPEQCRAEEVDHRTDTYAFGVLCYQLLTGQLPYDGPSYLEIMMAHVHGTPVAPSEVVFNLPKAVDRVVLGLMAKNREQRPERLTPVVEQLAAAMGQPEAPITHPRLLRSPSASAPPDTLEVAAVQGNRWRRLTLVALAMLGVAAAVLVGFNLSLDANDASVAQAEPPTSTELVPPPPPTPPPEAAPEPEPEVIRVTLGGTPAGARVLLDGELLGELPCTVEIPRSEQTIKLVVRADGFLAAVHELTPLADTELTVELEARKKKPRRRVRRSKKRPKDKDSIEEVDW